jgi:integrase
VPKLKLTQLAVDKLKHPPTRRAEYFDTTLPGFALRLSHSGRKSWVVFYRAGCRLRRHTFPFKAFSKVDQARERAREIMRDVARGIDPGVVKAPPPTVAELATQFIEQYAKRHNKSWRTTDAILHRHVVPRWRKRAADDIRRADVLKLLDALVDAGTPIAANRVLSVIRKMFNWSIERGILETSPAYVVKAPSPEVSRDRVLSDDEIVTVWNAADAISYPAGAFIHVLMLTGQRRAEVARMRWADIDMQSGVWTLARSQVKNSQTHQVPLNQSVMDILADLPRQGCYVFSVNSRSRYRLHGSQASPRGSVRSTDH